MDNFIKPLPFKPPRLIGLSEQLLCSHYENNYGGAVRRLNATNKQLDTLQWQASPGFAIKGLTREELIATNSMILHEVYFDALGGADGLGSAAVDPNGALADVIRQAFGSVEQWREQFIAMGKALAGGSGWVILSWSPRAQRLVNHWPRITHTLADGIPILAHDMYEHAYHIDFGANADAYLDAWLQNLHWDHPAQRFAAAQPLAVSAPPTASATDPMRPEELRDLLTAGNAPMLLDVCLADDVSRWHDKLPNAQFIKHDELEALIPTLAPNRPIVAYCMYGYQVSGNAVLQLREHGYDGRALAGGIAAWRAIGEPTEPLQT